MTTDGKPERIQRKRSKGWRMPAGAVYVGRPTKFGNWWTIQGYYDAGYSGSTRVAAEACVELFRSWLTGTRANWNGEIAERGDGVQQPDLELLRGKDLACWCRLDSPCHADVLLELANR